MLKFLFCKKTTDLVRRFYQASPGSMLRSNFQCLGKHARDNRRPRAWWGSKPVRPDPQEEEQEPEIRV